MHRSVLVGLAALAMAVAAAGCSNPNFSCTGTCDGVARAAQVISAANANDACQQLVTNIQNAGCTGVALCTLCVEQ
ncbi:MAG TPA: hypothetical protein VEJ89_15990 [Myxococcaceae bacterium]|jgi:hypothetical protein|nr:hypothetical protein [Myxococcaceae bacterium]